jgi:hypothetical protein
VSPSPYVSVLDELLHLRAEARRGWPFHVQLGTRRFEEMVAYTDGYLRCAWRNGVDDSEYGAFRDWLSEVRGELPEDWKRHYLEACGGDSERAMMRLLDFAAEFVALHPRAPPSSLFPGPERYVSVLEELLYIRARVRSGFPFWLALGTETLPTLLTLVRGYVRCAERHGLADSRWLAFSRWLAEARHLTPEALLSDASGDHLAAMTRLLGLVATYEQEGPPAPG